MSKQGPGEDEIRQKNTGKHQPPPQAHFTSPNPPRPSRRSVSDGVIQLIFVFGAMLSLVQSIRLAREGLACENRRTQGLRFKERVRQVIFRYAPLEWFGKSMENQRSVRASGVA